MAEKKGKSRALSLEEARGLAKKQGRSKQFEAEVARQKNAKGDGGRYAATVEKKVATNKSETQAKLDTRSKGNVNDVVDKMVEGRK